MTESPFWLVNSNGNVFTLSSKHRHFRQLVKTYQDGVRLKRVAACQTGAWGIGNDHKVYIFVHASEVPIRVQESTYENQRWSPLGSYTGSHLLPTERSNWSDEQGNGFQPKESFQLPLVHWKWDGDWEIDDNFQGEVASRGGWQYAPNFPGKWTAESRWNSLVRKRKWIRFRRFMATNVWAKLPIKENKDQEASENFFIDIAVGGFDIPNQPKGHLCVWGITFSGKVYVRRGVTRDCPEGEEWGHISTEGPGLINISVGPTGLMWGVTWDGQVLVRLGVSREQVYGTHWTLVTYPESSVRIMQVAVGLNSLWALSREGKVWYRNGIQGTQLLTSSQAATGSVWVEMVGEMSHIAVTPRDQVFAIGLNDKEIYFRTGVTSSDLGGKTWQVLVLKENTAILQQDSTASFQSGSFSESDLEDSYRFSSPPYKQYIRTGSATAQSESGTSNDGITMATVSNRGSGSIHSASSANITGTTASQSEKNMQAVSTGGGRMMTLATPIVKVDDPSTETVSCKGEGTADTKDKEKADEGTQVIENSERCEEVSISSNLASDGTDGAVTRNDVYEDGDSKEQEAKVTEDGSGHSEGKESNQSKSVIKESHINEHDETEDTQIITSGTSQQSLSTSADTTKTIPISEPNPDLTEGENSHDTCDTNVTFYCENAPESAEKTDNEISSQDLKTDQLSVITSCDNVDSLGSSMTSEVNDDIYNFVTDLLSSSTISKSSKSDEMDTSVQDVKLGGQADETSDIDGQTQNTEGMSQDIVPTEPKSIPWTTMQPSVGVSGTISTLSSPSMDQEVYPLFEMTPAMPRYCWAWLSGMACWFEDPAKVPWLQEKEEREDATLSRSRRRISLRVRDEILMKFQMRNAREIENFQYIENAVQRTSWLKKGNMKWYMFGRRPQWVDCTLELEQGHEDHEEGTLTINYAFKGKQRHTQICIQDIVCVKRISDYNDKTAFTINTPETVKSKLPVLLKPLSESDTEDWISLLYNINAASWNLSQPILPGSIWSNTMRGDVFIHPTDKLHVKGHEMCWMQHGGHFRTVESSPCGITWAIGHDHSVWVYSGGYGGGIFKATSKMSKAVNVQTDVRTVSVYENQKWYPVIGFSSKGFLWEGFTWSNSSGHRKDSKEEIQLPSGKWTWVTEWQMNYEVEGGVDNEGWQYSTHYEGPFHINMGLRDSIRRRKWTRKCRLETLGPWESCASFPLRDVSLQTEGVASRSDPVVVWGVGTNGNVLSRLGVSLDNPQGDSWIHVETDQSFQAVSVGGSYRVWALARDGSAWYRPGVTQYNITGNCWLQVVPPPPLNCLLKQVSVGGTAVWALDTKGNLWQRQEITETFPEGTRWSIVANTVRCVSVGPEDQVWIVAGSNFMKHRCGPGVMYRRLGISPNCVAGTSWEQVIGTGWEHVSVRGYSEPEEEAPQLPTKEPL